MGEGREFLPERKVLQNELGPDSGGCAVAAEQHQKQAKRDRIRVDDGSENVNDRHTNGFWRTTGRRRTARRRRGYTRRRLRG
jgi:hypothetical protein